MRRKLLCTLLVVGAALLLTACGASPVTSGGDEPGAGATEPGAGSGGGETAVGQQVAVPKGGSYARVPPAEFQRLTEDEGVVVVNTHVPFEGNLPRTDLSVPYNEIGQSLDRLPADKNARIAVYCKTGRMSAQAAEELVALGYKNIRDLEGGMEAWRGAGLPLEGV